MQTPLPPPTIDAPPSASVPLAARDTTLDALRGVAILGILLANVSVMVGPGLLEMNHIILPGDEWLTAAHSFLVSGKFRGLLSILFGIGMAIQYRRLQLSPDLWHKRYGRRMAVLFGLGMFHAILIWPGDVLTYYAAAGMIAMLCVRLPMTTRLGLAGGLILLSSMIGLVAALIPGDDPSLTDLKQMEILAFTSGSYVDQLAWRLSVFPLSFISSLVMIGAPLSLFLVGSVYADTGLTGPSPSEEGITIRRVIYWIFGFGVILSLGLAILVGTGKWSNATMAIDLAVSLIVAPGLCLLLLKLFRRFSIAQTPFIGVGRYALTIYITQSILGTGFALWSRTWGEWSFRQHLFIAGAIILVSLALGWALLKTGVRGPLETVYRRLGRMR
ncbi:MAG: DUF418 domain-containing protein [Fimbriimonadaceae bacterium]|nr:DUF418 domain-containing protein [Fimbriimonadaceae bacterium]